MPQRTIEAIAIAALTLGIATAHADSVTLRDGTTLSGIVRQIDGGYDITLEDGKHKFVTSSDVKSVKLTNEGKVSEENAHERLLSLQRSVEAERDLDRVIERYEQFIAMNADTEAAGLAETDLNTWRERKAQGMLKVGREWMTAAQRDAGLIAAAKTVDEVRALIAADKLDEASALLRKSSEADPENISYLYLTGVLQLRREQFFEAKRSFDAVAERIDNHPPTLVNLAVLAVQFKRWPQALAQLEQAMLLAPRSQEILDDVVELQQLAPDNVRRSAAFERLAKLAAPLEANLQERQAQRGLYRLGSTWVDKTALDKAKAELDAFESKKADLEKDYQDTQEAMRKADDQIRLAQRMIDRIEHESLVRDVNGNVIRRRYPDSYWDLQRDLAMLENQQRASVAHVADLRKQAEVVKASAPKAPYAGRLWPIDDRGVPVLLPASAATRPATQPANETQAATRPAPVASEPTITPASPAAKSPAATMPTTGQSKGLFEE